MHFPEAIKQAVFAFSQLPGVGEKTALRFVMAMTKWNPETITNCSKSINGINEIKYCSECGVFSDTTVCSVCSSQSRIESSVLCIVENINDLMAIEKSNEYKGVYHILGGVLNPLAGIGPKQLRIDKLIERIKLLKINSLILALGPSVEGDATCSYIRSVVDSNVNVERIGFGIPMGGNLDLLDSMTISKALENRKLM